MTWKEMVDRTKRVSQARGEVRFMESLPPEQLAEYLGDDVVQKIRKHDIQKVKKNFRLNQPDVDPDACQKNTKN
jgi:hypothetical protein